MVVALPVTSSSRPSPCHFNTIRTLQLYSELNCTRAGQVQGKKVTTGRPSRRRSSGIEAQPERPTLPLQGEAQPGRLIDSTPAEPLEREVLKPLREVEALADARAARKKKANSDPEGDPSNPTD